MSFKILIGVALVLMSITAFFTGKNPASKEPLPDSIYDFKIKGLSGQEINFADFKGKKMLIVNTASKCGKTPQYAGLEKLHEQYGSKVRVLGFPANNFLWQEPGSNEEIAAFCEKNYGVRFQMFEKVSVKGGDKHPLYRWLEAKTGETPDWNFAKYLISEDGTKVTFFKSSVQPLDKQLLDKIME